MANTYFAWYGQTIPCWYSPGYSWNKDGGPKTFVDRRGAKVQKRHFITSPGVMSKVDEDRHGCGT